MLSTDWIVLQIWKTCCHISSEELMRGGQTKGANVANLLKNAFSICSPTKIIILRFFCRMKTSEKFWLTQKTKEKKEVKKGVLLSKSMDANMATDLSGLNGIFSGFLGSLNGHCDRLLLSKWQWGQSFCYTVGNRMTCCRIIVASKFEKISLAVSQNRCTQWTSQLV